MRIAYETMLAEFERVLTKYGFSPERAHEAAEIFAQNSLAGVFSHGLNRFPRVVEYLRKGEIDPAAEAVCTASFGAMERWDGQRGFGPLNARHAMAADVAASEPAEPGREVRCPGMGEHRSRKENMELGIPVAEEKWAEVLAM